MHLRTIALFAPLVLGACITGQERDDITSQFRDAESCPAARVVVTAIARPASLAPPVADHAAPPPPPDIARDPERAAIWARTHDPTPSDPYAGHDFFAADGCGRRTVYACDVEPDVLGSNVVVCNAVSATP